MRRLAGFPKAVRAVAFLPNGRLVAGGDDKWVRVFDPTLGECVAAVKHRQVVYALAAAPDGKAVAYAGGYGSLRAGSNVVRTFNPDDGRAGGEFVWDMGVESRSIGSLSYSADGKHLAAACFHSMPDRMGEGAYWWQRRRPGKSGWLPNYNTSVVQFAAGGSALAVAASDHAVLLAEPTATRPERGWEPRASNPSGVRFLGPDTLAMSAGSFLYFLNPPDKHKRVKTGERMLTALAASPDGRTLLTAGKSGVVEAYDAQSRALRSRHDFGVGPVHGLAFAPDGLTFALAGEGGLVVCDAE